MPNPKTATTSEPVASSTAAPETYTSWKSLTQAKLIPIRVDCQTYPINGVQKADLSCHTRLIPAVDTFKRHMAAEHGGEFQFYVRKSEGKASPLWEDLTFSGLEASDLRCAVCNEKLRFHPASFERHLRPHAGNTKQAYNEMRMREPQAMGQFNVSLGLRRSTPDSSDEFSEE